jgi:cytochrome c oxidase assembly factor CtaG
MSNEPRAVRWRPALAAAGGALMLVCALPPLATLAHRYVFAESVQFVVFSMAGPALIVLGAPWRQLGLSRAAARLAAARGQRTSLRYGCGYLIAFIAVCLAWRLPPAVDALARHPALAVAELVTLALAGTGLWLELVASPPLRPRLSRPLQAAVAAVALWSTWAVAYALGFANGRVFHAYDGAGSALSAAADQQITVGLVWAVAAACFVPVVFASLLGWLRDSDDPAAGLFAITRNSGRRPAVRGWERGK